MCTVLREEDSNLWTYKYLLKTPLGYLSCYVKCSVLSVVHGKNCIFLGAVVSKLQHVELHYPNTTISLSANKFSHRHSTLSMHDCIAVYSSIDCLCIIKCVCMNVCVCTCIYVTLYYFHYQNTNNVLQWLQGVFLQYLEDWGKSVQDRPGFTALHKGKMCLSP